MQEVQNPTPGHSGVDTDSEVSPQRSTSVIWFSVFHLRIPLVQRKWCSVALPSSVWQIGRVNVARKIESGRIVAGPLAKLTCAWAARDG